ncbi:MAG: restriction endonuclease [Planctomycetota bacterium]
MTIYDALTQHPELYLSSGGLQGILQKALVGLSLAGYPLRTRSKIVKTKVCEALGYPVPERFSKVRPRFCGQNFDTYVQKANNLQIWNEEVSRDRRYVVIQVNDRLEISAVKVVTGSVIAALDKTGTLTQKYQAAARQVVNACTLVVTTDTDHVQRLLKRSPLTLQSGTQFPPRHFLPISDLYSRLCSLAGSRIVDPGSDQERYRGAALHEIVERALSGEAHEDTGQFPDVPEQLLELKLQMSPTIDLGLICPDSTEPIELIPKARHCDVRYAVFYATPMKRAVQIDHVVVSTGESFFSFFRKFEGKEVNRKLQIRLPDAFWA